MSAVSIGWKSPLWILISYRLLWIVLPPHNFVPTATGQETLAGIFDNYDLTEKQEEALSWKVDGLHGVKGLECHLGTMASAGGLENCITNNTEKGVCHWPYLEWLEAE